MVVSHNQKLRIVLSNDNTGTTGLALLLIVSKDGSKLLRTHISNGYYRRHTVFHDGRHIIHIRGSRSGTRSRNCRICFIQADLGIDRIAKGFVSYIIHTHESCAGNASEYQCQHQAFCNGSSEAACFSFPFLLRCFLIHGLRRIIMGVSTSGIVIVVFLLFSRLLRGIFRGIVVSHFIIIHIYRSFPSLTMDSFSLFFMSIL